MEDQNKVMKMIVENQEYWKTITIALLGKMRGGKTNIAAHIAKYYEKLGWEIRYASAPEPIIAVNHVSRPTEKKGLVVILDDLSFLYSNVHSEEIQLLLNRIARIRHYVGTDNVIVVMIYHYLKSIPPFLRETNIRVLVGPLSNVEAKRLWKEGFFNYSDIKDYIDEVKYAFTKKIRNKRPVLITDSLQTHIVWIEKIDYQLKDPLLEQETSIEKICLVQLPTKLPKNIKLVRRNKYVDIYAIEKTNGTTSAKRIVKLIPLMEQKI